MQADKIYERLKSSFGEEILDFDGETMDPSIKVSPSVIAKVSAFLRDEENLSFDSLMCLSGIDLQESLTVVYHLFSTRHRHRIVLKADLPKDDPTLPTVEDVWRVANWFEREVYDLYGIHFEGHSDLRRILLPDDWEGHPLRKDYKVQEFYQGIKVEY